MAEQRYQAVLAVIGDGATVTEVAARFGVARKTVHDWLAKYEAGGLEATRPRLRKSKKSGLLVTGWRLVGDVEPNPCRLRQIANAHRQRFVLGGREQCLGQHHSKGGRFVLDRQHRLGLPPARVRCLVRHAQRGPGVSGCRPQLGSVGQASTGVLSDKRQFERRS